MRITLIFLIVLFGANLNAQFEKVRTQNGWVSGKEKGSVFIFKGIPFAKPPVGNLRWQPPKPAENWEGVLKCEHFSASPMQTKPLPFRMWTEEFLPPITDSLSEDCLYLNIWTNAKKANAKLPVFVWIYGGGFVAGSSSCAIYDGEEMAKNGVVFISINYRVGIFGFFCHPELTKESANHTSGNYGILDQIEALKWIKNNIAAFGGDPNNITIAGQSAGSMSVNMLILSPLAKGLFNKAIAQSGGIFSRRVVKTLEEGEKTGIEALNKFGVKSISELRNISSKDLFELSTKMVFGSYSVVADNLVIPVDYKGEFIKGNYNDVPVLTGWVMGDGFIEDNVTINADSFKTEAYKRFGDSISEFLKMFPANTDEEAKISAKKLNMLDFAGSSAYNLAINSKKNVYVYLFTHVPPDKPGFPNYGAFHSADVPYALHTLAKWNRSWQQSDYLLEQRMSDYWVNFTKTGNPNSKGLPKWEPYKINDGNILELNDSSEMKPGWFIEELKFLNKK